MIINVLLATLKNVTHDNVRLRIPHKRKQTFENYDDFWICKLIIYISSRLDKFILHQILP